MPSFDEEDTFTFRGESGFTDREPDFGIDASLGGSIDVSGVGSGAAGIALRMLPPDVQSKLNAASASFEDAAATAAPLIDIAGSIGAGKGISDEQAVAGLSTIATAVGGPIGGAAMAAAGGLVLGVGVVLKSLFDALGLYDHPAEYHYVGLRRTTDPIPYGKGDPDWWRINSVNALNALMQGHVKSPVSGLIFPAVSGFYNYLAQAMFLAALQQLQTPGADPKWPHTKLIDFEKFFLPMLIQNFEGWANGSGFVPTRTLLGQAVSAWNATHGTSPSVTFSPVDYGAPGYLDNPIPSMILGGYGDLNTQTSTRSSPISINMGPLIQRPVAARVITPKKTVLIHQGAPGSAAPPVPVAAMVATASKASLLRRLLPYVPAVSGALLVPVFGFIAPVIGGAVSALWIELKK